MSQSPYAQGQYRPDPSTSAARKPKPSKGEGEDTIAADAWRWVGMVVVGAVEAVGGAFLASWVVGFLHQWWPAIPLLHWTLALWIMLALTAFSLFKDVIRSIGKKVGGKFYKPSKPSS